jgi:hypothetical protein
MSHDPLPRLDDGLTHVRLPHARSTALHRLVVNERRERDGPVYWLDARNEACSHVLYELAPHHRVLDGVRVARAFTAYQHHTLVRQLVRTVSPRTALVVAPNLGSLYEDDDVPDYERDALFDAALAMLGEVGATYDLPVLVSTAAGDSDLGDRVASAADHAVDCEQTRMGVRYSGDAGETTVYVAQGYWQTTIPYWVDLLGTVERVDRPTPATDLGPALLSGYG